MASKDQRLRFLPASVRAVVKVDDGIAFRARTQYVHKTWARTYTSLPELFIQPQSQAEIEKVVNLARKCKRRITTVGCGHSPSDMTCTSSWLVNLDNFNRVVSVDKETGLCVLEAGIRLYQLCEELDRHGLAMPSLGSINEQSIAGAISTGTHSSSLDHGLVSESIVALKITLADGKTHACSPTDQPELFRAALLSLGGLGIITEVTFQAVPAFSLAWDQTIDSDSRIFKQWDNVLWRQAKFVRVWWFPYMRRAVVWKANVVTSADLESGKVKHREPPTSYYDGWLGYVVYHNLLALSRWVPRILPWVEWFVFGMQYGFGNGEKTKISAVQPSQKAFLMNCLYSQFVNEWAIPLHKGPEALMRLGAWLQNLKPGDPGYVDHGIPFSVDGLWVHSPVEVRVSDTTLKTSDSQGNRPYLDPTREDGPTLYLNAIMYRPYHRDPTYGSTERYYQGFEWLMRELGGRPHWAKNFTASTDELQALYGEDMRQWRAVHDAVDPDGMFVGPWQRRYLLPRCVEDVGKADSNATRKAEGSIPAQKRPLRFEESGFKCEPASDGGIYVVGRQNVAVEN
ncbi:D-arabinono-1,4-lactone oxidase-domain-containing protein [Diplogelasinospora grovesii]|uniref:D-arabinono-1,4-lactone oxidase n=1 Tax=Diplogelasinospora grovesii TaxID=303347 RepID=A0AAN6S074_9PEZI|nr:D-arabinono-1,4-lactone oxidase-domain-containing protein [Diplogelasinospora grovesii]